MKITSEGTNSSISAKGTSPLATPSKVLESGRSAPTSSAGPVDRVNVSQAASNLAAQSRAVETSTDAKKLSDIKTAVATGAYPVEIRKLAEKILKEDMSWPVAGRARRG